MMSINLDPVVASKLQQFARRRKWLIIARGFCAGVMTFLICLAIVAAIDWYWLVSDRVRWTMSLGMYLPVLLVVWITCLRRMIHQPAKEEIASQVELSQPELRENLLSAVELATDDPSSVHDSPVFRSLLQGQVALQMGRLQVPALLPVKLVAKWMLAAGAVLLLAIVLLSSGDGRFRQLAVRAILPGANIARVSRVKVEVLQPTPHSLMLAEDETVAVIVDVSGGQFDEVTLETITPKQGSVRQVMRGRTDSEFVANIHVRNESVEYRVLAGDAVTEKFRIESRPRPRVTAFTKVYQYPDYSLLPNETVTESHGDLLVLQGTKAELVLELDQAVSEAELRIDPSESDEMTVIPLIAHEGGTGGKTWKATVPIEQAAIYKVHLVSKETGFENLFSPKYEIRPQPDLIPRAGFVDQQESTLLLPPNDIVALKAMAEDDLPLVSLEQHVSVNGRDWLALPLETQPLETEPLETKPLDKGAVGSAANSKDARRLTAAWQWDLMSHKLKTGDSVMTKLVATDRKGNIGESIPLRVIIAATDFDPERHSKMHRKMQLVEPLTAYSVLLEEHKKTALETIERLRKPETSKEQAAIDRVSLTDMASRQREQAEELMVTLAEVTKDMSPGAEAHDLEMTARVVARIQREHTHVPGYLMKVMPLAADEKRLAADLDELKRTFERTADDAKNVAEHFRAMAGLSFVNSLAVDLHAMLAHQKTVVESPTQTWERLLRHETLALNQLKSLEKLVRDHRRRLPTSLDGHMNNLVTWTQSQRERLQEAMESEEKLPQLKTVSADLLKQLQDRQRMDAVDSSLPGREVGAWRDFDNRSGSLYVPLEQVARAIQQENQLLVKAAESPDSAAGKKLLDEAERFATEVELKFRRSLDQLRVRRELTQSRQDADAQYAADAGLTHRAAMSVLYQHHAVSPLESKVSAALLEIAPAYRILEAGRELATARSTLDGLVNDERWESQEVQSHLEHPRQWDLVNRSFELASQRLREAGVKNEVVSAVDQARWSAAFRDAGRKISERRWKREAMIGAGSELLEIRDDLKDVFVLLDPVMAEARAVIAKYSPTIPQMAQQAAEQLRRMEEATTAAADEVEKPATAEATKTSSPEVAAKADVAKSEDAEKPEDPAKTESEAKSEETAKTEAVAQKENAPTTDVADNPPVSVEQQLAELEQQQESINQQLRDLTEALVEDANAQDLLEESQRERARDADDSIAMIQEPATQMNQALEKALETPAGEAQAKELAQAAEQQEKTAQALELVAKHFGKLEEGQDVAESRAELRQAERDLGIARQLDEQYDPAKELAAQADKEAQQLLSELEAELQKNPVMQQALSEISQNALQEARNALDYAAQDDQAIQQANERSDAEFQTKKRELAEDLREMAAEASQLSGALIAQANQSAAIGKTAEAQKKLTETQQKLNETAAKANSAREDQLLPELAQTAQEAKAAMAEANELLKQAKQQTQVGKDEKIHADDKAREAQQKDSEKRRQQFHEQQKRTANDIAKRADEARKRTEQAAQNAEKEAAKATARVQQARDKSNAKPDDEGLKRNLQQEELREMAEQKKVAAAKSLLQEATDKSEQQKKRAEEIVNKPQPALDAQNPATQMADQLADEALKVAEQLNQKAEQLAAASDFGKELTPTKAQLAQSQTQQQLVTEDVNQASTDVARAARHERRLNNAAVAEPLQAAANSIQQAAANESAKAEQQLAAAATEAEQGEAAAAANPQSPPPQANGQSLQAQQDIAAAEEAFTQQAKQLTGILDPLLAASQAAENAEMGDAQAGEAQAGSERTPPAAGTPEGQAAAATSSPPTPSPTGQANTQPAAAGSDVPTAEELARGQQMARTLDELDRRLAAAAKSNTAADAAAANVTPIAQPSRLDTLAQAARSQQAAQAAARRQAQQELAMALGEGGLQSSDSAAMESQVVEFGVTPVDRTDATKWGKLRSQSADDLTKGKTEAVSEEYRKSVETYFRVLAERGRKK